MILLGGASLTGGRRSAASATVGLNRAAGTACGPSPLAATSLAAARQAFETPLRQPYCVVARSQVHRGGELAERRGRNLGFHPTRAVV